jgi:alkylhydroperoxidase family enzyme
MHSRDLLKLDVAVDKLVLVAVWHDAGNVYTHRERIALSWAETVTRIAETGVPDADYAAAAAIVGMALLGDATTPLRILCLMVILAGVIGLKLVSGN